MTSGRRERPTFHALRLAWTSASTGAAVACLATETQRPAAPPSFLVLHVGGQSRAVPIERVCDIGQADCVEPGTRGPSWIRGELPLRGARVPVVDLAVLLGQPPTHLDPTSCVVVADLADAGRVVRVGLLADEDSRVTSARLPRWAVLPVDEILGSEELRVASHTGPDEARGTASRPVSSAGVGRSGTHPLHA